MSNLLLDQPVGEISKTTFLWITYVLLSIISLKWLLSITRKAKTHHKLPPSPFRLPVIGNLHQLGSLPHRKLTLLAKSYGPIMLLHLGNKPTLVVSSASYAQEFLKTHDTCFLNRPELKAFKKVSYGGSDIAVSPYGDTWKYMRSLLAQQILSPKRVKAFRVLREEETFQLIKKIEEVSVRGDPFNLSEFLYSVQVGLLCKVAFGEHFSAQTGSINFKDLLEELMLLVGAFDVEDFIPWLGWINKFNGINTRQDKVFQKLNVVVENILKDHTDNNKARGGER
uniref:Cytochrome P450 n=1 Tax=Kalanchoe fedtschenkoi TaxID=63787 RepID=A0A7N0VDX3_KALFE